jgi:hypothetical protein
MNNAKCSLKCLVVLAVVKGVRQKALKEVAAVDQKVVLAVQDVVPKAINLPHRHHHVLKAINHLHLLRHAASNLGLK